MADDNNYYYNHRVRLVSVRDENLRVEFKVTPTFTENRSVEYTPITPIHMPGAIQVYKNTGSRTFGIGAVLVSRNVNEAGDNIRLLQTLRTWTLPYFGRTTTVSTGGRENRQNRINQRLNPSTDQVQSAQLSDEQRAELARERVRQDEVELLGAPPMVLYLYAYSTTQNDSRGSGQFARVNINRVPVVITSLTYNFPNDVDYFPASTSLNDVDRSTESFPTRMEISVECVETHSPREYERFDLQSFYNGKLVSF